MIEIIIIVIVIIFILLFNYKAGMANKKIDEIMEEHFKYKSNERI